ncbi:mRNA turnover protein 4 [Tanacetum coccineum]
MLRSVTQTPHLSSIPLTSSLPPFKGLFGLAYSPSLLWAYGVDLLSGGYVSIPKAIASHYIPRSIVGGTDELRGCLVGLFSQLIWDYEVVTVDYLVFFPEMTLSKTKKKGREDKEAIVNTIRVALEQYNSIYVFSFENMRNLISLSGSKSSLNPPAGSLRGMKRNGGCQFLGPKELNGGSTMFLGISDQLTKELRAKAHSSMRITVDAPRHRICSVWNRGSLLAFLLSYQKVNCSYLQDSDDDTIRFAITGYLGNSSTTSSSP